MKFFNNKTVYYYENKIELKEITVANNTFFDDSVLYVLLQKLVVKKKRYIQ